MSTMIYSTWKLVSVDILELFDALTKKKEYSRHPLCVILFLNYFFLVWMSKRSQSRFQSKKKSKAKIKLNKKNNTEFFNPYKKPTVLLRQSNVDDICRWQIIETCGHKNHFFLSFFVRVPLQMLDFLLVIFPTSLTDFANIFTTYKKISFALHFDFLLSLFLLSIFFVNLLFLHSRAHSNFRFFVAPQICQTLNWHQYVRILARRFGFAGGCCLHHFWLVCVLVFFSTSYICLLFRCTPFSHRSTHLVTNYKLFKFNFFTCSYSKWHISNAIIIPSAHSLLCYAML